VGRFVTGDFLATMAASSRARVAAAIESCSRAEMERRALAAASPPALRLSPGGFDLIAELKLRSPAAGVLRDAAHEDLGARVTRYAEGGAAAVSILTEPSRFDGALEHLAGAAKALASRGVPAMRKDFLVDPYQAMEARAAGAGGVLVILRMLPRAALSDLVDVAAQLGLFVLLEAFDDLDIALAHEIVSARPAAQRQLLVGVNSRDLATLDVIPGRLEAVGRLLPLQVPRVAESGLASADDAARLAAAGYDVALVGSALMRATDPRALATTMLAAGRGALGARARLPGWCS
jgi:indole-3-glycerol phosphate synthase